MSNSNWETKDDKVKIGNEWKDKDQVMKSFMIELVSFVLFIILCIWAFTNSIIFGLVCLLIVGYLGLLCLGSYSALKALGLEKPRVNFRKKVSEARENIAKKIEEDVDTYEIVNSFVVGAIRTGRNERQAVIKQLKPDSMLEVNDDYIIVTNSGKEVGELTKSAIDKIMSFPDHKVNCRVVQINETKNNRLTLRVEIMIIKE